MSTRFKLIEPHIGRFDGPSRSQTMKSVRVQIVFHAHMTTRLAHFFLHRSCQYWLCQKYEEDLEGRA